MRGLLLLILLPAAAALQAQPRKGSREAMLDELSQALTFHASFDHGTEADFALGDKRIYTASSYKNREDARPGFLDADFGIVAADGRYGAALQFKKKNTRAVYYQADKNVAYRKRDWSGTVSFWLSLDPDRDLEPGFCDPIQVTAEAYNDAAAWTDFTKDDKPRHFRLGVFGDLKAWNPKNLGGDNPDFLRRLIVVTQPPFARGQWTHIAITFAGLNTDAGGTAKLYLNGQLQGTAEGIREPFTWDLSRAAIRLGVGYIGLFDDLAVFNRALSDREVQLLYRLPRGVAGLYQSQR